MRMEPFQVHAIVQTSALLLFLLGAYYARDHRLKVHHLMVYSAVLLLTIGVAYMLYTVGGVRTPHGALGLVIYAYVVLTAFSGKLFLKGKLSRNTHRAIALSAILLLFLQIAMGLYLFVLG